MISFGRSGEKRAASYLKKKGYQVIEMNYRSKFGEIDLIAKKDEELIFVEVKARSSAKFGMGYESVTAQKQEKLVKTAQIYMMEKGEKPCRFDVISIDGDEITHIEGAF